MSLTLAQIYALNPSATIANTDLFYLVHSPYTPGTDSAILGSDLKTIFGSGTVNSGLINQLGYFAAAGTTISGLATANNGTLVTSNTGVPSILAGPGTTGNILLSNAAAAPSWSTSTIPSSAGAIANKVLLSNGTNYVLSTPTFPNASAVVGKIIISDGTNWIASTPTYPLIPGIAGNVMISDGTNWTAGPESAPLSNYLETFLLGGM
jgi:hypothetical protein